MTEADTCHLYVVPRLPGAGWEQDPHRISEQVTFTDGRIIPFVNLPSNAASPVRGRAGVGRGRHGRGTGGRARNLRRGIREADHEERRAGAQRCKSPG
jgi:hypothetical protein